MLNSKMFNFKFFLGGREIVDSLKIGAVKNGGATKFKNNIYSNIESDDFIKVSDKNTISIFVPSTININDKIDNKGYVEMVITTLLKRYDLNNLSFYDTEGSWYDEINNDVVIEKITIVTLDINCISIADIQYFINIAESIKNSMNQQAVSISINDSLAIV